jgi:atypical dual specificity phosphatase
MIKSDEASVLQVFISNDKIQQEREKTMAMTKVFERLYVGDSSDADSLAVTNPFGITGVVNVSTEANPQKREGIKYVHFPLDEYEWILPRRFDLIMTAISKLIRSRNVLVHCGAGVSRSPVVVALYLHIIGYKNFDDALFELRNLRPVVAPSKLILERAKAYLEGLI